MNTAGKVAIGVLALAALGGGAYVLLKGNEDPQAPGAGPTGSGNSLIDKGLDLYGKGTDAAAKLAQQRYPAGTLLRGGDTTKIYQMDAEGKRHWISSRAKFDSLGLSMGAVKSISQAELLLIPEGSSIAGLALAGLNLR